MTEEFDALVKRNMGVGSFASLLQHSGMCKARLVAKGFHQRSGIDYHDTFSPVIQLATIRLVLSITVTSGWPLRQLDVNNAFLQGRLHDDVYMVQSPGFVDQDQPSHVCKLHKALYGLKQAPRLATPMSSTTSLVLHSGSPLDDPTEYRNVVGSLQYLNFTRPDIAFTVNKLSQFMHRPTTDHWQAVKRVLRYLVGSPSLGIFMSLENSFALHAFSDANWGGNRDEFTSTSAHAVYLGNHPISWSSKKERTTARSSTEVEYKSVASTAAEL
ncbi:PREDICTED: uncharacterized protein LOC109116370 [Tarenaya hassleriana]|uniref:uncharacterized protein LOC109116370 n=1 Tax=Tarenaya hassleriana TaxID=28532 RepID=UPI0008FD7076|nr:PREDICTED: uncharacterized protein LOC109116370 [Tarenaya hassleriana]